MHANQIGYMVDAHDPRERTRWDLEHVACPECGQPMRVDSARCKSCAARNRAARAAEAIQAERMGNHRRFEAALSAGWTLVELVEMRPDIPTWAEIDERR